MLSSLAWFSLARKGCLFIIKGRLHYLLPCWTPRSPPAHLPPTCAIHSKRCLNRPPATFLKKKLQQMIRAGNHLQEMKKSNKSWHLTSTDDIKFGKDLRMPSPSPTCPVAVWSLYHLTSPGRCSQSELARWLRRESSVPDVSWRRNKLWSAAIQATRTVNHPLIDSPKTPGRHKYIYLSSALSILYNFSRVNCGVRCITGKALKKS